MADEKIREENGADEPRAKAALLDNKLVLLGIIVVLQALMALAIVQFVIAPRLAAVGAAPVEAAVGGSADQAPRAEPAELGEIVDLGEVMVTLRDVGGAARYVRIDVNVEVEDAKAAAEVERRMPQLRDLTILALSAKSAEDLQAARGVEAFKGELRHKLGEVLPGELRNVYFSDLVIQ